MLSYVTCLFPKERVASSRVGNKNCDLGKCKSIALIQCPISLVALVMLAGPVVVQFHTIS